MVAAGRERGRGRKERPRESEGEANARRAGKASRCSRARGGRSAASPRCPYVAGRVVAVGLATVARRAGGPHRSVTAGKWRKREIENVFSPLLRIAILTNLKAEFGKTPIIRNVVLFEFYNFVKRFNP